jgi:phage tail tube protein FII
MFEVAHSKIESIKGRLHIQAKTLRPHALGVKSVSVKMKPAHYQTHRLAIELDAIVDNLPVSMGLKSFSRELVRQFATFDTNQQMVNYVNHLERAVKTLDEMQDRLYKAEGAMGHSKRKPNGAQPAQTTAPVKTRRSRRK